MQQEVQVRCRTNKIASTSLQAKYEITDEQLRPYFALPNVLDGLFKVFNSTYWGTLQLPCAVLHVMSSFVTCVFEHVLSI